MQGLQISPAYNDKEHDRKQVAARTASEIVKELFLEGTLFNLCLNLPDSMLFREWLWKEVISY